MTTGTTDASLQPLSLLSLGDDPTFGFKTTQWLDPSSFETKPPENDEERQVRISIETNYKNVTDCTYWHRYSTLGRHAVDGHTFDKIMLSIDTDPLKAHCLIWYQYMHSIDRKFEIPVKLEDWATKKLMAYLAIHSPGVLLLDTNKTTWPVLLREQSLASDEWTTVEGKSRKKKKSQLSPASARNRPPPIPKINEEPSESELETPKASPTNTPDKQKPSATDEVSKSSSAQAHSFSRVSFRKSTRFFYRPSSIFYPSIRVHLFNRNGWPPTSLLPFFHLHLLFQPCPRKIVVQQISMKMDLFVRVSNRQI